MTGRKIQIIELEPKTRGESTFAMWVILAVFMVLAVAGIVLVAIEASS